jgi:hypothetical protein
MAKKRLAFDVEEDFHSTLKQLAAEQGITLGVFCSATLEAGLGTTPVSPVKIDPGLYSSLPLDKLRAEATRLGTEKSHDWETCVRKINSEIVKRYVAR